MLQRGDEGNDVLVGNRGRPGGIEIVALDHSPLGCSAAVGLAADRDRLRRFEQEGFLPQFQIVRLGNDHTRGTSPGALTPRAYLAQNDFALGQLVEGVSKSKFWSSTAIFVVEDDAQDGPDHGSEIRVSIGEESRTKRVSLRHRRGFPVRQNEDDPDALKSIGLFEFGVFVRTCKAEDSMKISRRVAPSLLAAFVFAAFSLTAQQVIRPPVAQRIDLRHHPVLEARKAAREIFYRLPAGLSPGPHAHLWVRDDGCGIDEETRQHIFEPFFTTKPPGKGTGLGLSQVHGLVRQMGGNVSIESRVGEGTSIRREPISLGQEAALYGLKNLIHRCSLHPGSSGVILCWKEHFIRTGGFDERLEVRENSELMKRLKRFGRYRYIGDISATTSMRRYEQLGVTHVACLWLKLWTQSILGDLHQKHYQTVR